MSDEEMKDIWMSGSKADRITVDLPDLLESLKGKMKKLDRILFYRDAREIAVAILAMIFFTYKALTESVPMVKISHILFVIWSLYVIYRLIDIRKYKKMSEMQKSLKGQLKQQKIYLQQQAYLLDSALGWYILPPAILAMVAVIGSSLSRGLGWGVILLSAFIVILICCGLYYMNKRAARTAYKLLVENINKVLVQLEEDENIILKIKKMYRNILIMAITILFSVSLLGQNTKISKDLESNIKDLMEIGSTVGMVIGTVDGDQVNYYSTGLRSATGDALVDENSIFEIGSISKTFTGLMLADMVIQGRVKLDDDIQKYLPDGIVAPTRNGASIKLYQLSNHTSGLPGLPSNFNPTDPLNPYKDLTEESVYEAINNYELNRDIGEAYEYSNLAAGLLGHIISNANETRYEAHLRKTIAEPLGMNHTGITQVEGLLAKGHMAGKEVPNWDFGSLEGAGAIRSNASDMMIYLKANMGLTESQLYPAMQLAHKNTREADSNPIVGLGWHILAYEGKEVIWHNGGTGGYRSFMGWIKGTDKGVVVLNNSTENVDYIGLHVLLPSFPLTAVRNSIKLDDSILSSYVGDYELAPGFVLSITKEGKQLYAQATGQSTFPIYAESETKFYLKAVAAELLFKKDASDVVESVTLFQGGQEIPGKKIK